jgi:hypothetical protein
VMRECRSKDKKENFRVRQAMFIEIISPAVSPGSWVGAATQVGAT